MEKNVGTTDSLIRIAGAAIIFYFIDSWNSNWQFIMGIAAAALVFTGLNRFCVLYVPFKFNTKRTPPDHTK